MVKLCKHCNIEKNVTEFSCRSDRKDGYQSWCKSCMNRRIYDFSLERKKQIVQLMGGACKLCGYNKHLASLDLHHLDPSKKDFDVGSARRYKWDTIVAEVKKCILVCANCHREIHAQICSEKYDNNEINCDKKLNGLYFKDLDTRIEPTGKCPVCSMDVYMTKYCTVECAKLGSRKVQRPDKEQLQSDINTLSWCAMGRKYGVSDNAVRKWAKQYKLI